MRRPVLFSSVHALIDCYGCSPTPVGGTCWWYVDVRDLHAPTSGDGVKRVGKVIAMVMISGRACMGMGACVYRLLAAAMFPRGSWTHVCGGVVHLAALSSACCSLLVSICAPSWLHFALRLRRAGPMLGMRSPSGPTASIQLKSVMTALRLC